MKPIAPWKKLRFVFSINSIVIYLSWKKNIYQLLAYLATGFVLSPVDQVEKQKQDDALDDLSGVLGQLKGMAVDMGSELDR